MTQAADKRLYPEGGFYNVWISEEFQLVAHPFNRGYSVTVWLIHPKVEHIRDVLEGYDVMWDGEAAIQLELYAPKNWRETICSELQGFVDDHELNQVTDGLESISRKKAMSNQAEWF